MIDTDKFRGDWALPLRSTLEEAATDHSRLLEVLGEHAPELLGKRAGKVVPGGSPLKDITARTP